MSTTRQSTRPLTFGGEFRRLRKDLKDMNRDTRKRYLDSARQDATYCHDDDNIQTVEERIIKAVSLLEACDLFQSMTIHHLSLHGFSHHWDKLQAMTSRWKDWCSAWNEHVEQRGDLINDREWEQDAKILKKLFEAFIHSEPKGFEQHHDWIDNYAPESGVIEGVQKLSVDADFKASDMLIPPYTAVSIDALVSSIRDEDGWIYVHGQTPESFRKKQLAIIQNVKSLQAMKLQEGSLFAHMIGVGTKYLTDFTSFSDAWQGLLEVCSKWSDKLIGVLICLNYCKDRNWKMDDDEHDIFNLLAWQSDRHTLNGVAWLFREAEPKGLKGHPGWTEDQCYASCLTTTRAPPCLSISEEAGAPLPRITSERAHGYGHEGPTDITFGGAWRNLIQDLKAMEALKTTAGFEYFGMKQSRYWQRILELEQRITPSVQKLPKHPLFQSMVIGPSQDPASKERFRRHWNALEMLSKGWEYYKSMFLKEISWKDMFVATEDWEEEYHNAVHWDRILHVLEQLRLADGWPEGSTEAPEWTEDSRRVAELMGPTLVAGSIH